MIETLHGICWLLTTPARYVVLNMMLSALGRGRGSARRAFLIGD